MTTHNLEDETQLIPEAVAGTVTQECAVFLDSEIPLSFAEQLSERAVACYAKSQHFRKLLNERGNSGRDWLYCFMRSWLAAILYKNNPDLFRRLPTDYCRGMELPQNR